MDKKIVRFPDPSPDESALGLKAEKSAAVEFDTIRPEEGDMIVVSLPQGHGPLLAKVVGSQLQSIEEKYDKNFHFIIV